MEFECSRHPGASTIGSYFLDETAPMAGKSRHSSHEPLCIREEGHPSLWYNNYIWWTQGRVVGGETTQKLWSNAERRYNKHEGSMRMCTTEDHWLHRLASASSRHALVQVQKWTRKMQGNADPDECISVSASQNTSGHEGMLTWVNA